MALGTYDDLKAAISNWMFRSDLSGDVADFITLGESGLNRELPAVITDATLTGTIGSRSIDLTAHSVIAPYALFLVEASGEVEIPRSADGLFPYTTAYGQPSKWGIDGDNIDFNCPLDSAYTFRLRFQQRFKLSDAAPTNWLLTNYPDVYLAACIFWGNTFLDNQQNVGAWAQIVSSSIPKVRRVIARNREALLTIDPALTRRGRYIGSTDTYA